LDETAAIILAAGKSTRMQSDLPKVLHEVCGRPMLGFVLSACRLAGVDRLVVVVGHAQDRVREAFSGDHDVSWVEQPEQLGTGHAVACCQEALAGISGSVLVVAGDMPLIRRETLVALLDQRARSGAAVSLATTVLDDPVGYGRIVRDAKGALKGIVEQRDCKKKELGITEVNPSYYCFDGALLFTALEQLSPASGTGEVYLTDTIRWLRSAGHAVMADLRVPPEDAMGINTRLDLARVARAMQDRIQLQLMNEGVTIVDPDNAWIEAEVLVGRDTTILPFSFVGQGAAIGESCRIGPHAFVPAGATIADGSVVEAMRYEEASSEVKASVVNSKRGVGV